MPIQSRVVIAGGGPVGCLAANVFAARGYRVDLYEKRPAISGAPRASGRTINLSLNPRGIRALDRFGVGTAVRDASVPMLARAFHPRTGEVSIQPYGKPDWQTWSITREELNQKLLALALRRPEVRVHFDYSVLDVDLNRRVLTMRHADGNLHSVEADLIVGADGVASAVRSSLLRMPRINFAKTVFPGGYRELTLRAATGDYPFYGNAIHVWPRGDFFMVALPNRDRTLRATLILPNARNQELITPQAMHAFLATHLPDTLPFLTETPAELLRKPVGEIVNVRCDVFHHRDTVLLLGDAVHAVVPFMGQGVNIGLEDCMALDQVLDDHGGDLETAFAAFSRMRLSEGLACADLSEKNLHELTSGASPPAGPAVESLVSRVNFSGLSYQAVAECAIPNWTPRVVNSALASW